MRMVRYAVVVLALAGSHPLGAGGPFDGVWKGEQVTIRKNTSARCEGLDHPVTVRIVNSHFKRSWGPAKDIIEVEVKPDGTLFGATASLANMHSARRSSREYLVDGRITAGVLEAEIGSTLCTVKWTLRRG
ncbi:MAG: hypothetical protein IT555_18305 [Acetobacteraceae bacterium]|nr:hypothetical protein [Acetobacteraceae bacterium]